MDPKLAAMYGTNVLDESDIEKLAAAEFAEQLANDGQIDLDNIDPDQLEALAQDVLGGEDAEVEGDDAELEDQEKVAEADYLGRVMAHAMTQEMRDIEKTAAHHDDYHGPVEKNQGPIQKGRLRRAGEHVAHHARKAGSNLAGGAGAKGFKERALGKAGQRWAVHGTRAGAAATVGAAAFGAKKGYNKLKKSSAIDTLAEQRAYEILAENGIEIEKVAADEKPDLFRRAADATESGGRKVTDNAARGAAWAGKKAWGGAKATGSHLMAHRGKYGVGAAAAGAVGAGVAGKRAYDKSKQSSALETLVEQRALEILAENGVDLEAAGEEEQEKVSGADGYDVLAEVVEQQAWALLQANGYVAEEE